MIEIVICCFTVNFEHAINFWEIMKSRVVYLEPFMMEHLAKIVNDFWIFDGLLYQSQWINVFAFKQRCSNVISIPCVCWKSSATTTENPEYLLRREGF